MMTLNLTESDHDHRFDHYGAIFSYRILSEGSGLPGNWLWLYFKRKKSDFFNEKTRCLPPFFMLKMEFQIPVQMSTGLQGAQFECLLGTFQSRSGARQVHSVPHQVAADPFVHASHMGSPSSRVSSYRKRLTLF